MPVPTSIFTPFLFWDPVLKRELLAGLRSQRIRWILLLYLTLPFLAVVMRWPTGELYYGGSGRSQQVWGVFLVAQALLIGLLTPIFSAYSVSAEFEQGTAEMLWTTALSPARIVFGKMMAIVLLCAALMLAAVPALSLIFFLGGVGADEISAGYVLMLLLTASLTTLGTFFSAWLRKGHLALLFSYLSLGLTGAGIWMWGHEVLLLPVILFGMFLATAGLVWLRRLKGSTIGGHALVVAAVVAAIMFYDPQSVFAWGALLTSGLRFILHGNGLAFCFLITSAWVFGWLACRSGRRTVGEKARSNFKPVDDPGALDHRRRTWPYYLVDPLRRPPPIADNANVMAEHEQRVHPLHRSIWGYRFLYPLPILAVPCALMPMVDHYSTGRSDYSSAIWWLCGVGIAPWIVLVHSISMTMEQEMRTFDALRLAGITPLRFLQGKWINSIRKRWRIMLAGAVAIAMVNLLEKTEWPMAIWAVVSWWLCVESLGLMVYAISGFCTSTMVAIAGSVLAALMMPFVFFLTGQFDLRDPAALINFFLGLMTDISDYYYYSYRGYDPRDQGTVFFIQTTVWILAGFIWWGIAFRTLNRKWQKEVRAT